MNYIKSFRGATQKQATDKALAWCRDHIEDEDAFIIFEGVGIWVEEQRPSERPVTVRPVEPSDNNAIIINSDYD